MKQPKQEEETNMFHQANLQTEDDLPFRPLSFCGEFRFHGDLADALRIVDCMTRWAQLGP